MERRRRTSARSTGRRPSPLSNTISTYADRTWWPTLSCGGRGGRGRPRGRVEAAAGGALIWEGQAPRNTQGVPPCAASSDRRGSPRYGHAPAALTCSSARRSSWERELNRSSSTKRMAATGATRGSAGEGSRVESGTCGRWVQRRRQAGGAPRPDSSAGLRRRAALCTLLLPYDQRSVGKLTVEEVGLARAVSTHCGERGETQSNAPCVGARPAGWRDAWLRGVAHSGGPTPHTNTDERLLGGSGRRAARETGCQRAAARKRRRRRRRRCRLTHPRH